MAAPGCNKVVSLYGLWSQIEGLFVLGLDSRVLDPMIMLDL